MSDASLITDLNRARTLVRSRFVPRIMNVNTPPTEVKVAYAFPKGFVIEQITSDQVQVTIDGSLHVTQNMVVDGGVDPLYLQLQPTQMDTPPLPSKGTLWVKEDNTSVPPNYSFMLDNNEVYNTSQIKHGKFANLALSTLYSCSDKIHISTNLVPTLDGKNGIAGFNLGSESFYWNKLYVKDLFISPNTVHIVDDDDNEMRISYDIKKGTAIIKTSDFQVESVTTSKIIPGQIDASLLPFTGLTFASKLNIEKYKRDVSSSLLDQLMHALYTFNKEVIETPYAIPHESVESDAHTLIKNLTGNYYIVVTTTGNKTTVSLPRVQAFTNLTRDSTETIFITSPFSLISEELVEVTDGDILIFYHTYVPNSIDNSVFDIFFGVQNINFRIPISSVANSNIINKTITLKYIIFQTQ